MKSASEEKGIAVDWPRPTVRGLRRLQDAARDHESAPLILIALLGFYFLLKPFYLWDSGLPQIADGVAVLLLIAVVFYGVRYELSESRYVTVPAALFCAWTGVVSVSWTAIDPNVRTIMPMAFYTFNLVIMYACLRVFEVGGKKTIDYFGHVVAAVIIIYTLLSFMTFGGSYRQTVYFNNPNQLSYWVLLAACTLAACDQIVRMRRDLFIAAFACGAYLSALALSKAGMAAYALLLLLVFSKRRSLLIAAFIVALPLMFLDQSPEFVERVGDRIDDIGKQADDSLSGRGIDRVWRYPQYLVFGAGEGHQHRLGAGGEIHSTLVNALFSFGVIGFALLVGVLWRVINIGGYRAAMLLAPPMVYGLTHQGLRFSLLWVLFAVLTYGAALRNAAPATDAAAGGVDAPENPSSVSPAAPAGRAAAEAPAAIARTKNFRRPALPPRVRPPAQGGPPPRVRKGPP